MSFRTKREIFLRSLTFRSGRHAWACRLATLRLGGRNFRIRVPSASRSFAPATQVLDYAARSTRRFRMRGARRHSQRLLAQTNRCGVCLDTSTHCPSFRPVSRNPGFGVGILFRQRSVEHDETRGFSAAGVNRTGKRNIAEPWLSYSRPQPNFDNDRLSRPAASR